MGLIEDLADKLSDDVMKFMAETGDDRYFYEVGKVIGASSPTLQEAFLTSMRIRMAEARGRKFLTDTIKARAEGRSGPEAPRPAEAGGH